MEGVAEGEEDAAYESADAASPPSPYSAGSSLSPFPPPITALSTPLFGIRITKQAEKGTTSESPPPSRAASSVVAHRTRFSSIACHHTYLL